MGGSRQVLVKVKAQKMEPMINNRYVSKLVSFITIQGFLLRYTSSSYVNFLLYGAMIKWKLINWNLFDKKNANFRKWFFFCFLIISLIKMKSRRHTVPIWKELNVFNTQILVWNKNLQNCRHSTKKYQYKKFLLRL